MDIHADSRIPFPPAEVFTAYRDEMAQLLPYLPNVRSVVVKSRKEVGSVVEIVNEWAGGGEVPAAVRAVLSESLLSWTDFASWNATGLWCDWRIETRAFPEALRCQGRNAFVEDGAGTTNLQIRGTLDVDARKMRGVPGFLAGTVSRSVESFLLDKIRANLVETANGLSKYLGARTKP